MLSSTCATFDAMAKRLWLCREYTKYADLKADYEAGEVHPGDLKEGLRRSLNEILEPVRKHFETDPNAKDLLKKVKQYRTTR